MANRLFRHMVKSSIIHGDLEVEPILFHNEESVEAIQLFDQDACWGVHNFYIMSHFEETLGQPDTELTEPIFATQYEMSSRWIESDKQIMQSVGLTLTRLRWGECEWL